MKIKKVSLMLLCLSFIMLGTGGLVYYSAQKFYATAKPASGKVIEIQQDMLNGVLLYFPVIVFNDEKGAPYKIKPGRGSSSSHLKIGQMVPILYDPQNPQIAKLDKGATAGFFSAFLFIVGGLFFVLSVSLIVYSKIQKRKEL